jgi:hypothetical protein
MPVKKRVAKEKVSKRGKGDVKQSVKVSVKIGETKPRRKRQYRRKAKGEGAGDLARVGETGTLYGNLPPQTITVQQQQPLPSAFQEQPRIAGLLEDVKRERQNLLEDIKRETQRQISKAQGEEQRGELARIGWIEPVSKPPTIEESVQTTASSFENIKQGSKPLITEISSKPIQGPIIEEIKQRRGRPSGSKNKPKIVDDPNVEGQFIEVSGRRKSRVNGPTAHLLPVRQQKESKIPVPNIEEQTLTKGIAEKFNLV